MNLEGKHILVMTSAYPQKPTDRFAAFVPETIARLRPTGAKFTVFAPAYEGSQNHWLDGVKVYRFRYFFKRFENLARDGAPTKIQKHPLYLLVAALYILLGAIQLLWVCGREKPDILHVNWPFPHGLMAWPTHKLLGIPMVFTFHGTEILLARKYKFVGPLLRWLLPMANAVTANSRYTQELIRQLYTGPIDVVPYGLTVEALPPRERQLGEVPRILFVGRLIERKGLQYLLAAMLQILAKQPARLRVVGIGEHEAEFKAQCTALGLDPYVDFLGSLGRTALSEEYAACDVFVLPSIVDSKGETEGLGIVMIEALAHAKPVVATEVGGIPDVVIPGTTGFLVPEKDPTALADAIQTLLADPKLAQEMGQRGLKDVQTRFSWSRIAPLWQQVFAAALDSSTTRSVSTPIQL